MNLTHIHRPITLGGLEVPNRVVRTAHATGMAARGIGDTLIDYHVARARGGVGLSIVELLPVHPSAASFMPTYTAPGMKEGLGRLVEAVRPHGMRLFQQLWHGGHQARSLDGGPPWSASDVPSGSGVTPLPMTQAMIDELVERFADAARLCEEVGYDGVDIHCAHGYLVHQFLSPNTNRRDDGYGGSLENRARFMCEVLSAVRASVSPGFVVGARFAPDIIEGGLTPADAAAAARLAQDRGLIDYVNISMGSGYTPHTLVGGMDLPMGYELPTSAPIVAAVDLPSIVIGRFRTLEEGDQVIRSGQADMIGMVRATLADPDLVNKTMNGEAERVRPCIACNQGCLGGLYSTQMGCVVNPAAGFEGALSEETFTPASEDKDVVVLGGGPSGMEAARVAALRGHRVRLYEAQPHLGGTLRLAEHAPKRYGLMDFVSWQESELEHLGVEVRLNHYMDAGDIKSLQPDGVIVATGSSPRMDGFPISNPGDRIRGYDRDNVVSSHDVFSSPGHDWGRDAVVVDELGHYEAIAVAEYLIEQGLAVNFVTRHISFAPLMETTFTNVPALQRLHQGEFALHTRTRLVEVNDDGALIAPTYLQAGGNAVDHVKADTVVIVGINRPNRQVYEDLQVADIPAWIVGEAATANFLGQAVRTGRVAGMEV